MNNEDFLKQVNTALNIALSSSGHVSSNDLPPIVESVYVKNRTSVDIFIKSGYDVDWMTIGNPMLVVENSVINSRVSVNVFFKNYGVTISFEVCYKNCLITSKYISSAKNIDCVYKYD